MEHIENLFLDVTCHSKAISKSESVILIKDFPDATSSFTRHPGVQHSSQYEAVDKATLTRPFVEVKNVVSSPDNKCTVYVSEPRTPGVGSQNERSPLELSGVPGKVCFCLGL